MKMSRLRIGNRCSIGPRAVVLYDAILEDDVWLDGLSLVMNGETLSQGTSWRGSPASRLYLLAGARNFSIKCMQHLETLATEAHILLEMHVGMVLI